LAGSEPRTTQIYYSDFAPSISWCASSLSSILAHRLKVPQLYPPICYVFSSSLGDIAFGDVLGPLRFFALKQADFCELHSFASKWRPSQVLAEQVFDPLLWLY
jgi:hypothetical protein